MLRFAGAQVVGVPRTATGYDLPALETLLAEHKPTVFFTQPRLQSPTCSVASVAHLHRLLQLAEQHHFMLVENDIYADMDPGVRPSLASLDQLNRVIYLGSFSKTISPNLRTGFLAARRDLLDELVQLKMISGLTSSEITERITFGGDLTFGADYPVRTLGLTLDLCFLRSGGLPSWQSFQSVV
jgi:DNA-binding transcriptional MocR family regulator